MWGSWFQINIRIPISSTTLMMNGAMACPCVFGLLCRSARDSEYFMKVVIATEPWRTEPDMVPIPWRPVQLPKTLAIGVSLVMGLCDHTHRSRQLSTKSRRCWVLKKILRSYHGSLLNTLQDTTSFEDFISGTGAKRITVSWQDLESQYCYYHLGYSNPVIQPTGPLKRIGTGIVRVKS